MGCGKFCNVMKVEMLEWVEVVVDRQEEENVKWKMYSKWKMQCEMKINNAMLVFYSFFYIYVVATENEICKQENTNAMMGKNTPIHNKLLFFKLKWTPSKLNAGMNKNSKQPHTLHNVASIILHSSPYIKPTIYQDIYIHVHITCTVFHSTVFHTYYPSLKPHYLVHTIPLKYHNVHEQLP